MARESVCAAPDCTDTANVPGAARGLCRKHYHRLRDHGSLDDPRPPIEDRFWAKVDTTEAASACWPWLGALATGGYGVFWVDGRNVVAHRWAYEHMRGPIPDGLTLDHLCRNRACVKPLHLQPVTNAENVRRGIGPILSRQRAATRTHCKRGHPLTDGNCSVRVNGKRVCLVCHRAAMRAYRTRKQGA